ncbi:hypothetical protein [Shinella sp.]|uniref:hypothetical protein n=1 Tax=Shinella sp. TaxID=1870904 RepID=UPI00289E0F3B|nr:hypothetical protein [Shinella sp.]
MIMTDRLEARDIAERMLKAHPEKLDAWLKDVQTFDGKPGLAAVKAGRGFIPTSQV